MNPFGCAIRWQFKRDRETRATDGSAKMNPWVKFAKVLKLPPTLMLRGFPQIK
jgi:hypothetical protein